MFALRRAAQVITPFSRRMCLKITPLDTATTNLMKGYLKLRNTITTATPKEQQQYFREVNKKIGKLEKDTPALYKLLDTSKHSQSVRNKITALELLRFIRKIS